MSDEAAAEARGGNRLMDIAIGGGGIGGLTLALEELVGDKPFDDLDRYITQAELQRLSDDYKRIAGFALERVA